MSRILFVLFSLFLMLVAPWWLTALFLIAGMFVFHLFFEAVLLTLMFEMLFGLTAGQPVKPLFLTVISALILFLVWYMKKNTMLYN